MILTVKNLGRIREAEIDIRPFTVYIGENNTNKTWLTYLLYGIFEDKNVTEFADTRYASYINNAFFEGLFQTGVASFDWRTIDLQVFTNNLCNHFVVNNIEHFFGIQETVFAHTSCNLLWSEKELQHIWNSIDDREIKQNQRQFGLIVNKEYDSTKISFEWKQTAIQFDTFKRFFARQILLPLARFMYHIFHIPAERTALTAFYSKMNNSHYDDFLQTLQKFKIEDAYTIAAELAKHTERSQYPRPIQLFLDFLKDVESVGNGTLFHTQQKQKDFYLSLAEKLRKILNIAIGFKENKRLGYATDAHFLDLFTGSSMLKSLSSLYLYLKNYALMFDTLIIDEPEMNLHPQAIVELTEMLAIFAHSEIVEGSKSVGKNLNSVILNTHSPYIIDHLLNLMEASRLSEENKEKYQDLFFLKDKTAFIQSQDVSVYLFENQEDGTVCVKNILDRENNTIDWSTFVKVSDKINHIFFQLPLQAQENAL